jgi:hypothetical protein
MSSCVSVDQYHGAMPQELRRSVAEWAKLPPRPSSTLPSCRWNRKRTRAASGDETGPPAPSVVAIILTKG